MRVLRGYSMVLVAFLVVVFIPGVALAQGSAGGEAATGALYVGAGYGVLQAVANLLMLFLPKNTVAFKMSKWLVAGVSRN